MIFFFAKFELWRLQELSAPSCSSSVTNEKASTSAIRPQIATFVFRPICRWRDCDVFHRLFRSFCFIDFYDVPFCLGFSLATGYYPVSVGFDPAYQGDFFPGVVSDLRIYNYPLPLSSVVQLGANGPTNNNIPPNSLWLELAGSFSDALGSGVTAVPYIGTGWYENYVTFTPEA